MRCSTASRTSRAWAGCCARASSIAWIAAPPGSWWSPRTTPPTAPWPRSSPRAAWSKSTWPSCWECRRRARARSTSRSPGIPSSASAWRCGPEGAPRARATGWRRPSTAWPWCASPSTRDAPTRSACTSPRSAIRSPATLATAARARPQADAWRRAPPSLSSGGRRSTRPSWPSTIPRTGGVSASRARCPRTSRAYWPPCARQARRRIMRPRAEVAMRRSALFLVVLLGSAMLPSDALAKFGMSKTKVMLPRMRPPAQPLIAETVLVEVKSESPEVTGSHVSMVRGRVEDALRGAGLVEVVDRPRDADAILRIALSGLSAEVRDEIKMESKYVKIGEREEWNEKKKKMETKDVYGYRDTPVSMRIADGSLSASVEIEGRGGTRGADAGASYHDSFKVENVPPEAATEESLRRFLVTKTAEHVIGVVSFSPDPVEALLAVNDELKNGNRLAESGLFQEALDEWSRHTFKGGTEAARLHNVGVAYEALAYKLPPFTPEHRDYLEKAKQNYLLAMKLDPGEKYFRDPPPRVDMSLSYAGAAVMIAEEMQVYREERMARSSDPKPAKGATAAPAKATPVAASTAPSVSAAAP